MVIAFIAAIALRLIARSQYLLQRQWEPCGRSSGWLCECGPASGGGFLFNIALVVFCATFFIDVGEMGAERMVSDITMALESIGLAADRHDSRSDLPEPLLVSMAAAATGGLVGLVLMSLAS